MDRESKEQGRTSKDKSFLFSYQIYGFVNGLRFHNWFFSGLAKVQFI